MLVSAPVAAQDAGALDSQAARILKAYCVECHGDLSQRQGKYKSEPPKGFTFVMDTARLLSTPTKERGGRYLVPGDPEKSEIFTRVRVDDMPYGADEYSNEPVPDGDKDVLRRWIESLRPAEPGG